MLVINSQPLPRTETLYVAFRLACLDTRERLELAHQLDLNRERSFGFLTEVPFLRNVAAQVQMDLLLETWHRHVTFAVHEANMLDEAVLYGACDTAAHMVRREPEVVRRFLARGPAPCDAVIDKSYADTLQKVHLQHAGRGLFLLISQFQDIPPDQAQPLKTKYGLTDEACAPLFDALGRWYVSKNILTNASGLLSRVEAEQLGTLLTAAKCCASS